jgi:hypothetical protein
MLLNAVQGNGTSGASDDTMITAKSKKKRAKKILLAISSTSIFS